MQEELFKQAREQMKRKIGASGQGFSTNFFNQDSFSTASSWGDRTYNRDCNGQTMEHRINHLSSQETKDFISKNPAERANKERIYLVYKFLNTPMEALIDGLRMKSTSDLNKFYKKLAMQLHPDKNLHPKANEAFQKVSSVVHSLKNKTQ